MKFKHFIAPLLLLLTLGFREQLVPLLEYAPTPAYASTASGLSCPNLPKLMQGFLQYHVQIHDISKEVRNLTAENYLDRVDPSRLLFLEKDAEWVRGEVGSIFKDIEKLSRCEALDRIQSRVVLQTQEMERVVREFVGSKDYKLDESVELVTDPEKRGWAKAEPDRETLLKKHLHFQISNLLDSGTAMDAAKKQLIHRYELATKRVKGRDSQDSMSGFLDSFAQALDPHSSYLSPEVLEEFQINMGLSLEGIGVSLSSSDGYTVVEEIIPGGAADRLSVLKPKDKIIAVSSNNSSPESIIDMELREVVRMIRGKKGTKVKLVVLREAEATERLTFSIVRDKIDLKEQAAKLSFETLDRKGKKFNLAVIELPSFYGDRDPTKRSSYRDVKNRLKEAALKKPDGMVLDLSRNAGGLLDDAVRISGLFMHKGGIVATRMGDQEPKVLEDEDESIFYSGPLIVWTSRLSASASEILAGALKDYRRAIIVGDDHTFGKGSVQTVVNLPPGLGALKITTGLFYLPGGHSNQLAGVPSDVQLPPAFLMDELGERSMKNPLPNMKIERFISNQANSTKAGQWKPVDETIIKKLAKVSSDRVQGNAEFKEIAENLEKAKKKGNVIKLADVREKKVDPKKDKKGKATEPGGKDKKDEKTPQYTEVLNILADYVDFSHQQNLGSLVKDSH